MFKLSFCLLPLMCLLCIPVIDFNYGAHYWIYGISLSILISLSVSIIIDNLTDFIGGVSSRLFIPGHADWTLQEQLAGPLNQIRFLIGNHRFSEASVQLEQIITRFPDHAEALFLKAQLLWEGYNNISDAKRMLSQVIKITREDDPYHRLAENLYRDLVKAS